MKQTHPNLDDEALDIMIENVVTNESSASMSSSTSTNVPNFEKV